MDGSSSRGTMIALAVAALLGTGCEQQASPSAKPRGEKPAAGSDKPLKLACQHLNACKGTSACMTPANECAGMNACKGKGWVRMPEAECREKGGTPTALADM